MGWSKMLKQTQSNSMLSSIELNNELNSNHIGRSVSRRKGVEKFINLREELMGKRYKEEELVLFLFKHFSLLGYEVYVSKENYKYLVELGYCPIGFTSYREDMVVVNEDELWVIESKGDWSGLHIQGLYTLVGQVVFSDGRYDGKRENVNLAVCVSEDHASYFCEWTTSFVEKHSLHLFTVDGYGRVRYRTPKEFVEYIKLTKVPLKEKLNTELTDRYMQERINQGGGE